MNSMEQLIDKTTDVSDQKFGNFDNLAQPRLSISPELTLDARERGAVERFASSALHSAVYTFVQSPLDAVSQLGHKTLGTAEAPKIIDSPVHAPFGSAEWVGQQVGGVAGALPYFITLHKGSRALLERRMLSPQTRYIAEIGSTLSKPQTREIMRLQLATAGATGLAYGGLFTPVAPQDKDNFWLAKGRAAVTTGATFTALSGSMMGLKGLGEARSATSLTGPVLRSDIGAGALSGIPAGLVHAQTDSLLRGEAPSLAKNVESVAAFTMIGGLMPVGQRLLSFRPGAAGEQSGPRAQRASEYKPTSDIRPGEAARLTEGSPTPEVRPLEQVFRPEQREVMSEWNDARSRLPKDTNHRASPEGAARLNELAERTYREAAAERDARRASCPSGREPGQQPEIHMLLGNCGAGKSRVAVALAREIDAMMPDSDLIKPQIEGYNVETPAGLRRGLGNQSVQEDSTFVYEKVFDRMIENGDNIVWQGVGKTFDTLQARILKARDAGYKVILHFMDAPPHVAAGRVYTRASQEADPVTGVRQMIPPEVPLSVGYQPRETFFQMLGSKAADGSPLVHGFRMWNTNLLPGEVPIGTEILKPTALLPGLTRSPVMDLAKPQTPSALDDRQINARRH